MLYNLIYYLILFICVVSILAIVVFARDIEYTTCRLAKQLLENKTRVCIYVGANYTQWNEYVPIGAGECPAIYFDYDFNLGRSVICDTFNSPSLTKETQFKIKKLEIWAPVIAHD